MKRRLLLPLLLAWGCENGGETDPKDTLIETDTDGPVSTCDGEAEVTLIVPTGELSGEVTLQVSLTHPDDPTAALRLKVSTDGLDFDDMTVAEGLTELTVTPAGEIYVYTWDTLADLGFGRFEGLVLQAVSRSETCNPWPLATVTDVVVFNEETPPPVCGIELGSLAAPLEGDAIVPFTLSHDEAVLGSVTLDYSTDGTSWFSATLAAADCDGDESNDAATNLVLSPEGEDHCLTWDSQRDLTVDADVRLRVSCLVQGISEESVTSDEVRLTNDPAPGLGELAITELMVQPRASEGHYVEIRNQSGHFLDLQGVTIDQWFSGTDTTGTPDTTFELDVPTSTLPVAPGAFVLVAKSSDDVSSGCLDPDVTWGATFGLQLNSTVALTYDGTRVAQLDYQSAFVDGLTAVGVAFGVDPSAYGATDLTDWCRQLSAINGCSGLQNPNTSGTPGMDNDVCP